MRLQRDLHNQAHEYYRKKNQAYVLPAMVFSAVATCLAAYTTMPDGAVASDASHGAARTASVLVALLTVLNTLALGISNFLTSSLSSAPKRTA